MIDALAFLPKSDVNAGMSYLQQNVPACDETNQLLELLTYFDSTYVSGPVRRVQRPATNAASIPFLLSVVCQRCVHQVCGMFTTQRSTAQTGQTTSANPGTAGSMPSSVITTHRCGVLLRRCSKMLMLRPPSS